MSAMHWEARRRQSALDRRKAQNQSQRLSEALESDCRATESNTTQQQAADGQCPRCHGNLQIPDPSSAKLPNRHSSLEYSQQW